MALPHTATVPEGWATATVPEGWAPATVLEPLTSIINHGDASTDMFSGQSDGDNY